MLEIASILDECRVLPLPNVVRRFHRGPLDVLLLARKVSGLIDRGPVPLLCFQFRQLCDLVPLEVVQFVHSVDLFPIFNLINDRVAIDI